jgi:hypothetical protein
MEIRKRELRGFLTALVEKIKNGQQQELTSRYGDVEKIESVLYELGFKDETAYRGLRVEEREYHKKIGESNERMSSYTCTVRVRVALERNGIGVSVAIKDGGVYRLTSENYEEILNDFIDDLDGRHGTCFKK